MAFPTSPSNGDEYTNALGTLYKYLTTDDKWYIINAPIEHNSLDGLNDGTVYEHISADQLAALHAVYTDAQVDAIVLTHKNITTAHHTPTVGGDLTHDSITLPNGNANEQHLTAAQVAALHAVEDKTRTAAMQLIPDSGATWAAYGVMVNVNTEGWSMTIKFPSNIDASKDVKIIFTWNNYLANAVPALKRWVAAVKTDGSEAFAWNIVSAQTYNNSAETIYRHYTEEYIVANAAIEAGDFLIMLIRSNETNLAQTVQNAYLEYEVL